MQQHPVPQNVTQYQFRLVGDMTLKQFLELLGGIVLAYLFFASNLIFIFKWPLVLLSIFLGVALAFFPIEDRPLDTWVTNFLKSIYQPTRFIWKKSNKVPSIFSYTTSPVESVVVATKTIKAPTPPTPTLPTSDLSADESARLSSLDSLFTQSPTPKVAPSVSVEENIFKPTISVRRLGGTPKVDLNLRPTPPAKNVSIPPTPTPSVTPAAPQSAPQPKVEAVVFAQPSAVVTAPLASSPAKTVDLPATPKLPNLLTGVVVDKDGKLTENAIVQVLDGSGLPVRALKTNSLGRFFTSTPLPPGNYTIETEKVGYTFSPHSLTVNNNIIPAIELRAS